VKLTLDASEGVTVSQVHAEGYKVAESDDDARRVVTLGDLFSEERKDIVFELRLPAGETSCLATLTLDYFACAVSKTQQTKATLDVERPTTLPEQRSGALVVEEQKARLLTMAALKEARAAGEKNDVASAQRLLAAAAEQLDALSCATSPLVAELKTDLDECKSDCESRERYRAVGRKKMAMFGHGYAKQRAPVTSEAHIQQGKRYYDSADHYAGKVAAYERQKAKKAAAATAAATAASSSSSASPKSVKPMPIAPPAAPSTSDATPPPPAP
jgi:hypothetical protein